MFNPYNYTEEDKGYVFQTDLGLEYMVYFEDYSHYFSSETIKNSNISSFDIVVVSGDADESLHDSRIGDTVTEILTQYFQNSDNVILFVCDSLDGREEARMRKFGMWFSKANINNVEKHDYKANIEDYQLLNSLLVYHNNSEKKELLKQMRYLNENEFLPPHWEADEN